MPVSLPNPLTDGTTAYGSQVKANDDAIAGKFTEGSNGISDGDIYALAAIKGTKLSAVAGNRIPFDRIEDDAVTADKLRDHASIDSERAVTRNHVRNGAIDKTKVSTTAGEVLVKANLDIRTQNIGFNIPAVTDRLIVSALPVIVDDGVNWVVHVLVTKQNATNKNIEAGPVDITANAPSPAIPHANTVLGLSAMSLVGVGATSGTGVVQISYIP